MFFYVGSLEVTDHGQGKCKAEWCLQLPMLVGLGMKLLRGR